MLAVLPLHVFAQCYVFKNCRNIFENLTFFFSRAYSARVYSARIEFIRQETSLFGQQKSLFGENRVYSAAE